MHINTSKSNLNLVILGEKKKIIIDEIKDLIHEIKKFINVGRSAAW